MATSAALVERTVPPVSAAIAGPPAPTPAKNTLPIERFMASAICLVRIEPEAPTSMPATISAVLSSAMPAAAADRPVKAFRVEMTTGMSAPPIGSTASTPSRPAATQDPEEQQLGVRAGRDHDRQRDRDQQQRRVDLARDLDRALERLLQLQEGDVRAPEGDRADDRREQDRDQRLQLEVAAGLAELDERDQRHRAAADAVEQRHHLRHRGHLHAARAGDADGGADRDADDDQQPVADARLQQRRADRDRHADGRDLVAAHRRARAAQPPQALMNRMNATM